MSKQYVVYLLTIGNGVYVGATSNYPSRCRTHKAGLKRLLQVDKLEAATTIYRFVNIDDLRQCGYKLQVYCYCDNAETAAYIEQRLINKYKQKECLLNVSITSGFVDYPAKKRRQRGLTSEQAAFRRAILRK